jgi:hypothetical protein
MLPSKPGGGRTPDSVRPKVTLLASTSAVKSQLPRRVGGAKFSTGRSLTPGPLGTNPSKVSAEGLATPRPSTLVAVGAHLKS